MRLTDVFSARSVALNRTEVESNRIPYMGEAFFPNRKKMGIDLKWIKIHKGLGVALKPSNFDAMPTIRTREGIQMTKEEMPFFRESMIVKEQDMIDSMKADGRFMPPTLFTHTIDLVQGYIGMGVKMGEGWLLTAEMLELADKGVENIVCTQPFGCLPNHICGKGMMKPIKARNPNINIVAIDYDAGATRVNQENRIKLMLANARERAAEREEQTPVEV